MIFEEILKYFKPLIARVQMMVTKGTVDSVDDIPGIQLIKASSLAGETQDGIERVQPYGLSANPPIDSEVVVVCVGGNKDHPLAIVVDNSTTRKKEMEPGEVAIYDHLGTFIYLTKDGDIHIKPNSGKFRLEGDQEATGTISAEGDITSAGDVSDSKGSLDDLRTELNNFIDATYSLHVHPTAAPGPPSPPQPPPPTP